MPGPAPMLCPLFPEAFLQQARREVRRKTAPYQTVQRYQLVLLLHENARLGHAEAGEQVGLSGRQVQRWRQRWAAGDFSVEDRSGRGRPSIFFPTGSGADQGHRL
jgi:predicted ArsR family transcriptional regulator